MNCYKVYLTDEAKSYLKTLDKRTQKSILNKIRLLETEPELRGKPLQGSLKGLRSIRAAGQRYRIIYKIDNDIVHILVLAIGIRKQGSKDDVYNKFSL